ncbi:MAG: serine acetyltransferase [Deltaproteobacteria bacterium]|nr:serine acetyltransferase [Deltaproteobacteria bacterium]
MFENLRADLARFPGGGWRSLRLALESPGFYAAALYRARRHVHTKLPRPVSLLVKLPLEPLARVASWALGVAIAPGARIGPGLYIGHWGGIRVGPSVVMGADCNLSPGVILGVGMRDGLRGEPTLGDRVYVAPGAKVFGPISIGSDVAIGANAVVCRDVPDHVSVGGIPARVISRKGSAAYLQPERLPAARAAKNEVRVERRPSRNAVRTTELR